MSEIKFLTLIIYVGVGLILALWPVLLPAHWPPRFKNYSFSLGRGRHAFTFSLTEILLLLAGIFLLLQIGITHNEKADSLFLFAAIIIGCVQAHNRCGSTLTAFVALISATAIPYWWLDRNQNSHLSFDDLFVVAILVCGITCLMTGVRSGSQATKGRRLSILLWVLYVGAALALAFMTASLVGTSATSYLTWHNWGVYIAASELLLSGARVFYDFPVQYGLGPTLTLAASCGKECWTGLYWLTGISNLFYAILIGWIAIGNRPLSFIWQSLILLASLMACFFYTASPPDLTLSLTSPSTGGLRFLPVVILASYLIYARPLRPFIAHLLWGLGALWSPESAFYCTFLWWPYFLLTDRQNLSFFKRLIRLPRSMLPLILALALLVIGFIGFYYASYDVFPSAISYLAYALFPPGPLDILPHGIVWFLIASFVLGTAVLCDLWMLGADHPDFRQLYISLLLLFGTSSYYVVGRSHENNVLNLMPFLVCLIASTLRLTRTNYARVAAATFLAAIIAWSTVFNGNGLMEATWYLDFKTDQILDPMTYDADNSLYLDRITFSEASNNNRAEDADRALKTIRETWGESAVVVDTLRLFPRHEWQGASWTAINNIVPYIYLPDSLRRNFIQKSALFYRKPGWLLISRSYTDDSFRQDFDTAYDETDKIDFGSYYAVRMVPRLPKE